MNLAAIGDGGTHTIGWAHRAQLERIRSPAISAKQHSLAAFEEAM